MPRKKGEDNGSDEWLKSAHAWSLELSRHTNCKVQLSMYPSYRAGVWFVNLRLVEQVDGRGLAIRCQVQGEYPNASRQSFGAYLLALAMQLDNVAGADPLTRALTGA